MIDGILVVLLVIATVALVFRRPMAGGESEPRPAFVRSTENAKLLGVCAGLDQWTRIPVWVWRLSFIILFFCDFVGLFAYIIFAVCLSPGNSPVPRTSVIPEVVRYAFMALLVAGTLTVLGTQDPAFSSARTGGNSLEIANERLLLNGHDRGPVHAGDIVVLDAGGRLTVNGISR